MYDPPLPGGLCRCGCGEPTEIAPKTVAKLGHVKGKPKPFYGKHRKRLTSLAARLHDGYEVDPATDCWVWQRAVAYGYGRVRSPADGRLALAHRVAYEQANGPIAEGLHVDHLCRNRACVNPDHLEVVTHTENVHRGFRHRFGPVVDDVRRLHAEGVAIRALAREYGITRAAVRTIVRRTTWAADL
jgi:hypothetical protein